MANYSLVVNSKFQPFSFERYIQPYQIYGEAYKEVENAYGELSQKANVWEEMANEQTEPYAYKMYKTYANDLEEQAGQLAREGLNAASRRDMLNMRSRYSKEIVPIEQAYTARQKQAEEQQRAFLQDPTLMLSRRAATTSLDDYIRNPQLAYESYSGKLITAQAASAAGALAKEMRDNPRKWRSILGNSYYETMMQKGFSSGAVLQAIQNNRNAAPELLRIVEDAVNSSGVRNWGDKAALDSAYYYARLGLWSAVGETQYQTLQNPDNMNPLQRLQYRRLLAQDNPNNLTYKPRTLSHLDASGNLAQMKRTRDNLHTPNGEGLKATYFGKNGRVNPLEVYEEYKRLTGNRRPGIGTEMYQAQYGVHRTQEEIEKDALNSIRKKYGDNIRILSDDEYNSLKLAGYNNKSSFKDFLDIDNKINSAATSYTEYFINGNPEYLAGVLGNNIATMGANDKSFANMVTILDDKFNTTSEKFDPEDYGTEENPIVDFSHSTKHDNKVIVTYKDGTKTAVIPSLISGETQALFNLYNSRKQELLNQGYSESQVNDYLEPYLMEGLTKLGLRGFNQGIPKTNNKLEEEYE